MFSKIVYRNAQISSSVMDIRSRWKTVRILELDVTRLNVVAKLRLPRSFSWTNMRDLMQTRRTLRIQSKDSVKIYQHFKENMKVTLNFLVHPNNNAKHDSGQASKMSLYKSLTVEIADSRVRFNQNPTQDEIYKFLQHVHTSNKQENIPHSTCRYGSQKSAQRKIKLAPKLTERVIVSVINGFLFLLIKGEVPRARNAAPAAGFPELLPARNHICPDSRTSCPPLHMWDSYWIVQRTVAIPGHSAPPRCFQLATSHAARAGVSPSPTNCLHIEIMKTNLNPLRSHYLNR